MFESWKRGWALTKTSFGVLKLDKEILALPLLSFVATIVAVVGLGFGAFPILERQDLMSLLAVFGIYVVLYGIALFFNVAVIEMASIRFNGGDPVLKDGLSKASSRIGRILQWALVAATVGMILRALRREMRESLVAQILLSFVEGAWHFVTYFALPIAIYQDVGPIDAIKGSTRLVRRTFGETAAGIFTTGMIFLALGLLAIVPGYIGFVLLTSGSSVVLGYALIGLAVAYLAVVTAINMAIDGILVAALYKYANEGVMPQAFREAGFDGRNLTW